MVVLYRGISRSLVRERRRLLVEDDVTGHYFERQLGRPRLQQLPVISVRLYASFYSPRGERSECFTWGSPFRCAAQRLSAT